MKRFSTFFEQNYSLVVGVAERRLDSRYDADEVASEAFRIAWQRYQDDGRLSVPWLYGVVRNLVGDEYRRRGRRAEAHRCLTEVSAGTDVVGHDRLIDVRDAVDRLPPIHRDVLIMAYWDQLTGREIASILGISAATVRARLMRARRLLRIALSDLHDSPETEVPSHE